MVLDPDAMVPAAGQGIVGVTVRADDTELRELLAAIEDPEAKAVSTAERALLAELDGSCRTPIGGHARLLPNGELHLTGLVARSRRLVPAEAQPARLVPGRRADRQRTGRQPARRQSARHLCLTPAPACSMTRPEPGASETARASRWASIHCSPVLAIRILRARCRRRAAEPVLVTSGNAIPAIPESYHGLPVLAVGETTAARLRAAGYAGVVSAGGDAGELAPLVRKAVPAGVTLLLVTGRGQGNALAAFCGVAGSRVIRRAAMRPCRCGPAGVGARCPGSRRGSPRCFSRPRPRAIRAPDAGRVCRIRSCWMRWLSAVAPPWH